MLRCAHQAAGVAGRRHCQLCGDGAPILIQRGGAEAADEALVRKGGVFLYYREHKLDHTTVYPGIPRALAAIRSSQTRAAQAGSAYETAGESFAAIVDALGWGSFFSQVYGGNSFITKKPDPEGRAQVVEESGVMPDRLRSWGTHTSTCARAQCRVVDHRRPIWICYANAGEEARILS